MKDLIYVFDLDGVITNPEDSKVNEDVVARIGALLTDDCHVAVNTGRSFDWVEQNLITRLDGARPAFERLYIVCEKGGESRIWHDGQFAAQPSRFALQAKPYELAKEVFEAHKSELPSMFWDATKRTMATIEKEPNAELDTFKDEQRQLKQLLDEKIGSYDVKIDPTTIATDIESPKAGKHAGAELIYEWVAAHTSAARDNFVCFGDSVSDYEMARYFAEQGATTTFVFVGKPESVIEEDSRVTMIRTQRQYDQGTAEYFAG